MMMSLRKEVPLNQGPAPGGSPARSPQAPSCRFWGPGACGKCIVDLPTEPSLADTVRDDLCVVHRAQYRAREEDGDEAYDERGKSPAPRQPQYEDGCNRHQRSPGRHA